jgi:hypothetical protein
VRTLLILLALGTLGVAACAQPDETSSVATATAATATAATATAATATAATAIDQTSQLYFRAPLDSAEVPPTFDVVFGLRDYGVAPAGVDLPNTGHFHILINVDSPAPGETIPADSLHRHYGLGQIETKLTLEPGEYTLRLVLADHLHRVISEALITEPIRVTVRAP